MEVCNQRRRWRPEPCLPTLWQDRPAMDDRPHTALAGTAPAAAAGGVTLRPLATHADYHACFELQLTTWGRSFQESVPPSVLKISQHVGGVAAGAFAADGRLLGFVWGLTGVRPPGSRRAAAKTAPAASAAPAAPPEVAGPGATMGDGGPAPRPELLHWSHMLAVAPEARDLGLGTRLKLYQRELLLPLGVEVVEWTYDPLEARNAHLNLNRLGAEVVDYVEDMYKDEMGSDLARGIGTDRFVVAWRLAGARAASAPGTDQAAVAGAARAAAAAAERFAGAPAIEPAPPPAGDVPRRRGGAPPPANGEPPPMPDAPRVRIEIPARIQEFKEEHAERALAWRLGTRRAFEHYLGRGYRVAGFWRDAAGRCFYGVEARGRS
jgi:predicted GNAT superfamily acetyltransferase